MDWPTREESREILRDYCEQHHIEDDEPKAVITIGARGQYRISIDHGPLDSEPTLAEAEDTLRYFGQTAYRFLTDDGETIVNLYPESE